MKLSHSDYRRMRLYCLLAFKGAMSRFLVSFQKAKKCPGINKYIGLALLLKTILRHWICFPVVCWY